MTPVSAVSDNFLSLLYLLHRVDLVGIQLEQLVDEIFLWGKRNRKVTLGCKLCCWQSAHQMVETSLLTLTAVDRIRGGVSVQKSQNATWASSHLPRGNTEKHSAHRSSVMTSISMRDLIPLPPTCRRRGNGIDFKRTRGCLDRRPKVQKIPPGAHLHNHDFNLKVRRQIQFGLESFRHGNQQMNGGQEVFVVDDWQAGSRQYNKIK